MEGHMANALEESCFSVARGQHAGIGDVIFGDKLGTGLPIQAHPAYNANEGLKRFSPHEIQGLQRIIDVGATISKCRYSG
jgi:hypothetical protein